MKQSLQNISEQLCLNDLEKIKPLKRLSEQSGVKVNKLALIIVSILLVMMVIEFGSCLIADVCGFIYPAYMSFKSLETKELDDDKIWLTYWVIYAILNIYRITLGTVLKIIPFYDIIRLIFYIYLFHPKTQGAVVIYDLIIKPIITKYENDQLDDTTNTTLSQEHLKTQ